MIFKLFSEIQKILSEAFFPSYCIFCKTQTTLVCQRCQSCIFSKLKKNNTRKIDGITIHYSAYYVAGNKLSRIIDFFKYRGFVTLAGIFSKIFEKTLSKEIFSNAIIVPIPLHWTRKIWRGFNQSDLLAKELSRVFSLPQANILKRIKKTKQQAKLKKNQRKSNMKNAFTVALNSVPKNTKILLVDDITTTGATFLEAKTQLEKHGFVKIEAICIATA